MNLHKHHVFNKEIYMKAHQGSHAWHIACNPLNLLGLCHENLESTRMNLSAFVDSDQIRYL